MYESLSFYLREAAAAPRSYGQRDGAAKYVRLAAVPSPADAALYSVDSMTTRRASGPVLDARRTAWCGAAGRLPYEPR
jgi:hypothetical protein